jgi:hypothetical protein
LLFFHSFECQGIQTKNPFDKISNLSFELGPLKVNTYGVKYESILQKTIKRIHIIKHIWWGKKKEDKNLLATLKKHSYLKICEILKFENSKKIQIWSRIVNFEITSPHINKV